MRSQRRLTERETAHTHSYLLGLHLFFGYLLIIYLMYFVNRLHPGRRNLIDIDTCMAAYATLNVLIDMQPPDSNRFHRKRIVTTPVASRDRRDYKIKQSDRP